MKRHSRFLPRSCPQRLSRYGKRGTQKERHTIKLGFVVELEGAEEQGPFDEALTPSERKTVLDHLHQSTILFAAGRGEALKRFLVEEGIGRDQQFWRLAQALSALYPSNVDENVGLMGCWQGKRDLDFRYAIADFRLRYCIVAS